MDKKEFIKNLIEINNDANASIINLEADAQAIKIENDKDKANFGNICVMLRGYRMVADASEAMLINENVLKGDDGFYQKIEEDEEETPEGAIARKKITKAASDKISEYAFQYAKDTGRKKVTAVHKANVLKISDGLFKKCFYEIRTFN